MYNFADTLGIIGAVFIIIAYFLLQSGKASSRSYLYLYLNLAGAVSILFSLYFFPNRPSIVMELFWVGISIYGLWRRRKGR